FDARQPQPHRHNITIHRGPPGFGVHKHRSQQGLDPYKRTLNPPSSPKKPKGQTFSDPAGIPAVHSSSDPSVATLRMSAKAAMSRWVTVSM
ncbi:MAG: hypothetical protein OXF65_14275, partial [Acidimicrobiaceae bacterium]|nr:hypothetical protein [Acidimicrobiaceae bacterium]